MSDLFSPPGVAWVAISPRLRTVRRAVLSAGLLLVLGLLALFAFTEFVPRTLTIVLGVLVLLGYTWGWWLIGRSVARWRYAETDAELFITNGAMFRKLIVVPYGRMQFVDVHVGPLDQLAGIAKVSLHTASPGTSAVIVGLPTEEAARLRDRLTVSGERQSAGL